MVTVVGDGALSPVDHDSAEPPVPRVQARSPTWTRSMP